MSHTVITKAEEKFLLTFRDFSQSRKGKRDGVVRGFIQWSEESPVQETPFLLDWKLRKTI